MKLKTLCVCVLMLLWLTGCLPAPQAAPTTALVNAPTPTLPASPTPRPVTPTAAPTATATFTPPPTDTPTAPPPTESTEPTATNSPETGGLIIDHTSVALFDQMPDDVIASAAALRTIHRASSIGENITRGLDCLWGHFPGRSSRPNFCSDFFSAKYDRSNWIFSLRGNPGWIQKVQDFVEVAAQQAANVDVLSFAVDYADGLDGGTYPAISDPENFQTDYVAELEALEAAYPDKTFVWWTMSLARTGFDNEQRFNQMLRAYARENDKILFDLADIETHGPDGVPTLDAAGREVLYPGYTDEQQSGHLNRDGRERLAKAYWVLIATLAGWSPSDS